MRIRTPPPILTRALTLLATPLAAAAQEEDPVQACLVASLRPAGGNVTGLTLAVPGLPAKPLELLNGCLPGLHRVAVLWNAANPKKAAEWKALQGPARALGLELRSVEIRVGDEIEAAHEIEAAVERARTERAGALLVLRDALTGAYSRLIAGRAREHRLATMFARTDNVTWGRGLMACGPDDGAWSRTKAGYIAKDLGATRPADLPVQQPTRFELVVHLGTAKALGLTIPPAVLVGADQILE